MNRTNHTVLWCTLILALGVLLSSCSSLSDIPGTVSGLNPFQQQEETKTTPSETAPSYQENPDAPPAAIWVESKQPALRQQQAVEVNVGDNKKCTTFCALPLRKPPVAN